jgi:hypothetical protein
MEIAGLTGMKKTVLTGLAAIGSLLLFGIRKQQTRARYPQIKTTLMKPAALARVEGAAHRCLMSVIVPVWIAAGLLDYIWHRRTKIETTSGPRESVLHLIMLAEGGPIILGPLLLEVNAGVLALMYAAYFAHQATAMWDVDSTVAKRLIPPDEQHVHGFLEGIPFCVTALYTVIHWDQFLSLLGFNDEVPRFDFHQKEPRVPVRDAIIMTAAVGAFDVLPHMEEFWRCWQAERRGLVGKATPECAPILFGQTSLSTRRDY